MCADSVVCEACDSGYLLSIISETNEEKFYDFSCRPCDENCLTCIDQPNICLSCDDNHRLENTKCIGRFTVGFVYILNEDFAFFLENSKLQNFIEAISNILGINIDLIFINRLYEGSTTI